MANNFRRRNNLGQFIALEDSSTSSSFSETSSSFNKSFEDIEDEIDPIENFEDLDLNRIEIQFQPDVHLPVPPPIMAYNLNPYNGNINPSQSEGLKLFLKATEERKDDLKIKITQLNVKNIMSVFESDSRKFGWSSLVHIVPIDN